MNKSKNILLINGFWTPSNIINEFLSNTESDSNIFLSFPLGVITIAGWCIQELSDFNIQIIDFMMELHKHLSNKEKKPTSFEEFVFHHLKKNNYNPDYIGISFSSSNGHRPNLELVRISKKLWPKCKIIVSGTHATTFAHVIIKDPNIDYIIRGTGDTVFPELIKCLSENNNPHHLSGVVSNIENITSFAPPLNDLNVIPKYPYHLLDMEYLIKNESTAPIKSADSRTAIIMTSRGCPFSCTYCAASQVHGKKVHFFDLDRIINEIKYLIETYHINQVNIIDDLFGADKSYFYEFFSKIDQQKLNFKLNIPAGLSINIYDEDMIDVLIDHGLDAVYFPLESGSKYVQKEVIKKKINFEKVKHLVSYTKSKNIFTGVNIILGFPGETKEMIKETYQFLKDLKMDWVAFFSAYPYPGTEMTDTLLQRGDITEDQLIKFWDTSTQGFKQRTFDTKEITGKELSDLIYDYNIKINFFENHNIKSSNYDHILPKLNKIIERFPFHIIALACRAQCYYKKGLEKLSYKDIAEISYLINHNKESKKLFDKYETLIYNFLENSLQKLLLEYIHHKRK